MAGFVTADSGKREEFDTGARRDTRDGKGRFDLVAPTALRRIAKLMERGAVKYGDWNWSKGMPFSRFLDSAFRHLNDYAIIGFFKKHNIPLDFLPEEVDPNEDHLAGVVFNVFCIMHFEDTRNTALDDVSIGDAVVEDAPENKFPRLMLRTDDIHGQRAMLEYARSVSSERPEEYKWIMRLLINMGSELVIDKVV